MQFVHSVFFRSDGMMPRFALAILIISVLCAQPSSAETLIADKINRLSQDLVSAYVPAQEKSGKSGKAAVFKFAAYGELDRKNIGFAVSELLTHYLAKNSSFTLMERMELNKVLSELRLNMSGVTSPDDALKAGKMGGATVLVIGSVERIGGDYHITARIVEAETSKVVATAYTSVPVEAFDEEARDYIRLVPETQTIGLYFLYNWRNNPNGLGSQIITREDSSSGITYTTLASPDAFSLSMPGLGVRYSPSKNVVLDFSVMKSAATHVVKQREIAASGASTIYDTNVRGDSVVVSMYRALASVKKGRSEAFKYYFGGGISVYDLSGALEYASKTAASYLTPTVAFRMEYFPQKRVGVSLSGCVDLISKIAKEHTIAGVSDNARLSNFYLEPSISVYF